MASCCYFKQEKSDSIVASVSPSQTILSSQTRVCRSSSSNRNVLVHLTAKEFELLVLFCKYPNRVFTSRQIFDNLWNTYGLEDDVRTVMVHISNLRKKIEINPEKPKYIQTVRGVGYKLVSDK